tara:strand:+ start:1334 stop:2344 length:1011 start_codon:yes stop_codon:yes gene_type:complete
MENKVKIAVDAMGGDNSPKKIIEGINLFLKKNTDTFFYLVGKQESISKELKKYSLVQKNSEIIHTNDVISDNESPFTAAKKGKESSMWKSIELLKNKKADIALSAGNTGAMLVISRLLLKTIEGINKPALAALWPNNNNMNVVLDLGANIECDEKNLSDFASMGAALFLSLFQNKIPKVALLNIGLEEYKGNETLKKTFVILKKNNIKNFTFDGFIEGNQIMKGDVDVIVTDGFTGNVALKTAEGTADFITTNLKKSLNIISILFSFFSLKRFKAKLDPRKYNGAIFLGLENPLVKSHGGTDSIGFAHSINVCNKIVKAKLIEKIKSNLITIDDKI